MSIRSQANTCHAPQSGHAVSSWPRDESAHICKTPVSSGALIGLPKKISFRSAANVVVRAANNLTGFPLPALFATQASTSSMIVTGNARDDNPATLFAPTRCTAPPAKNFCRTVCRFPITRAATRAQPRNIGSNRSRENASADSSVGMQSKMFRG